MCARRGPEPRMVQCSLHVAVLIKHPTERLSGSIGWDTMGKYSDILMDHFTAPRNSGPLDAPDATGHAGTPGRGPFLILYLRIQDDRIVAARFQTYGCGPTIACGSMLTEMIDGRPIADCLQLTTDTLIEALDGVPSEKLHSPALAIAALRNALKCYAPVPTA